MLGRVGEYCGAIHISKGKSWVSDNALYAKEFLLDQINLKYLASCLDFLNLNRFKKKSGQPLITQSIVYSQRIPIPNLDTQATLVQMFDAVDTKILIEKQEQQALSFLFQSLLNNLMIGKTRVNDLEIAHE